MRKASPLTAEDLGLVEPAPEHRGRNVVYFGPPGVGKSYQVKQKIEEMDVESIRATFHPEYSYGRFVGTYRPVVGREKEDKIVSYDGEEIDRPVSYFDFVPGPMVRALVAAYGNDAHVVLVIEEINRGDCAAIFGDFFQLLDRDDDGKSEYALTPAGPLQGHLAENGALNEVGQIRIPPNLSLYATMNTSDQSLFPMDSAFKRRWEWEAVPLMAGADDLDDVQVQVRSEETVGWLALIETLNEKIWEATQNEDKQIGPWYVREEGSVVKDEDIRNKLLHYIWHDVFALRQERTELFVSEIRTFDDLQDRYDAEGGIFGVLKSSVTAEVQEKSNEREPGSSEETATAGESESPSEAGDAEPEGSPEA